MNALLGENREDLKNADDWRNPKNWRVSINQLQSLLNNQGLDFSYNFLSNVPQDRRDAIKDDKDFNLSSSSAALMAERDSATLEGGDVDVSEISWVQSQSGSSDKFSIYPSGVTNKGEALTTAGTNPLSSLEVITNEYRTTPFKPSQLSSSQVAANQLWSLSPIVNIWANQLTIPHITTDEVSRQIVALQDGTLQVDITQMSAAQVNRSQVNPTQVNSMQDNISEISFPISITLEQFLGINNFGGVGFNSSIWHNSVAENSPFRGSNTSQIGIPQVTTNQFSFPQISTTEVSTGQINTNQSSTFQTRSSEIGVTQVTINQRSTETSPFQIGISKAGINQIGDLEQTLLQIDSAEINVHKTGVGNNSMLQLDASKVSLPSFITFNNFLSQSTSPDKFFKFIHNIPPTSTNTYDFNPLNPWSTLFDPTFNLTLQIENLPTQHSPHHRPHYSS